LPGESGRIEALKDDNDMRTRYAALNLREKNETRMKTISPKFAVAMQEYQSGQFTNQALAARHGVSLSTIHHWIRRAGVPRKPHGPHPLEEPSPTHRKIIELSAELTGYEIARRLGLSPQRVYQVLTRWEHLRPQRSQPPAKTVVAPVRKPRRELRSKIVAFRLTAPQADQVRATLMSLGFGNRLSNGSACRAVLLSAVGCGQVVLPRNGTSVAPRCGDDQEHGTEPSAEGADKPQPQAAASR
jgi:transposase